jgi:hypothetical protein
MNYPCTSPRGGMKNYCSSGHLNISVIRCRTCDNCQKHKIATYRAQIIDRLNQLPKSQYNKLRVHLWTFGTNLIANETNYTKLKRYWTLFMKRVRKKYSLDIFLRVFEAGSQGGKLHVHVIIPNYLPFKPIRKIWSEVTGISNPNVNYSSPRAKKGFNRPPKAKYAFLYAMKYMSKEYNESNGFKLTRSMHVGKKLWYTWKTVSKVVKTSLVKNKFWSDKKNKYLSGYISEAKEVLDNGNHGTRIIHASNGYIADYEWRDVPVTCSCKNCNSQIVLKFSQIKSYDYVFNKVSKMDCNDIVKNNILQNYGFMKKEDDPNNNELSNKQVDALNKQNTNISKINVISQSFLSKLWTTRLETVPI